MSGAITRRDLDVVGYAAYVVKLLLKKMMYVVVLSLGHRLSFVSIRLRVKKLVCLRICAEAVQFSSVCALDSLSRELRLIAVVGSYLLPR